MVDGRLQRCARTDQAAVYREPRLGFTVDPARLASVRAFLGCHLVDMCARPCDGALTFYLARGDCPCGQRAQLRSRPQRTRAAGEGGQAEQRGRKRSRQGRSGRGVAVQRIPEEGPPAPRHLPCMCPCHALPYSRVAALSAGQGSREEEGEEEEEEEEELLSSGASGAEGLESGAEESSSDGGTSTSDEEEGEEEGQSGSELGDAGGASAGGLGTRARD